eukprot:gene7237-9693_t
MKPNEQPLPDELTVTLQANNGPIYLIDHDALDALPAVNYLIRQEKTSLQHCLLGSLLVIDEKNIIFKRESRIVASIVKRTANQIIVLLPETPSCVLEKIVQFVNLRLESKNHFDTDTWMKKISHDILTEMALCAYYLDLKQIAFACARHISVHIADILDDDVRKEFSAAVDFTSKKFQERRTNNHQKQSPSRPSAANERLAKKLRLRKRQQIQEKHNQLRIVSELHQNSFEESSNVSMSSSSIDAARNPNTKDCVEDLLNYIGEGKGSKRRKKKRKVARQQNSQMKKQNSKHKQLQEVQQNKQYQLSIKQQDEAQHRHNTVHQQNRGEDDAFKGQEIKVQSRKKKQKKKTVDKEPSQSKSELIQPAFLHNDESAEVNRLNFPHSEVSNIPTSNILAPQPRRHSDSSLEIRLRPTEASPSGTSQTLLEEIARSLEEHRMEARKRLEKIDFEEIKWADSATDEEDTDPELEALRLRLEASRAQVTLFFVKIEINSCNT